MCRVLVEGGLPTAPPLPPSLVGIEGMFVYNTKQTSGCEKKLDA